VDHSAILLANGMVLVTGGYNSSSGYLASAELYNPTSGTWTRLAGTMSTERSQHTAVLLLNGKVLVAGRGGGQGGELVSYRTEIYDPTPQILLANLIKLLSGAFQLNFSNTPGGTNTILATTNPAVQMASWTVLGIAAEISSGQFQFTDPQATNNVRRFYRVRSP